MALRRERLEEDVRLQGGRGVNAVADGDGVVVAPVEDRNRDR